MTQGEILLHKTTKPSHLLHTAIAVAYAAHTFPSLSTSASTRAGTIPTRASSETVSASLAVRNAKIHAASTRRASSRGGSAAGTAAASAAAAEKAIPPLKDATNTGAAAKKGVPGVPSPRARLETAHAAVRAISTDCWVDTWKEGGKVKTRDRFSCGCVGVRGSACDRACGGENSWRGNDIIAVHERIRFDRVSSPCPNTLKKNFLKNAFEHRVPDVQNRA